MGMTTMAEDARTGGPESAGLSDAPCPPPSSRGASAGRPLTGHVVLDLPVPPSVNRARKINWGKDGYRAVKAWHHSADAALLAVKYRPLWMERFELHITMQERSRAPDLDNILKVLIDYLKRIEAIADDAPANLRRLVVEWGEAPEGVRICIKPWRGS